MADEEKHTPGPWSVADYKTLGTDDHVIRSPEKGRDDPHPVVASVRKRPGYKRNAHLIAAAPDLLAALHQAQPMLRTFEKTQLTLLGQAESLGPNRDTSVFRFQLSLIRRALAEIDTAIAKAEVRS